MDLERESAVCQFARPGKDKGIENMWTQKDAEQLGQDMLEAIEEVKGEAYLLDHVGSSDQKPSVLVGDTAGVSGEIARPSVARPSDRGRGFLGDPDLPF